VTIQTDIGQIEENVTAINAKLTAINETLGIIDTTLGSIGVELDEIEASMTDVQGGLVTINTTLGDVQVDIEDVSLELVAVGGDIEEGVTSITGAITDAEGNILLELGDVEVTLEDINATLASVDGSLVRIKTDIGSIDGTITSIRGDIAAIETDIGVIKVILEEWTGVTTSTITTPVGSFDIMVLTNSTIEGPAIYSDNTLTLIVSGQTGTTGLLNLRIPRQLLVGIGSNIEELVVTINDRRVSFTYTEEAELYLVRLLYTHSTNTIEIHLTKSQPYTWSLWILLAVAFAGALIPIAIALGIRWRSRRIHRRAIHVSEAFV
jgi:archaellum component FlaC